MIVGSLGYYVFITSSFYTKTYNSYSRKSSANWLEHKVIGEKGKLQFDGLNLEEISFNIHLNRFFNVNISLEKKILYEYMKQGRVLRLILGGRKIGNYVITSISEEPKAYSAIGAISKMDLKIELKEYN